LIPGSPHISYIDGVLSVEQVSLVDLACQFGTPLFVYSKAAMMDALGAYQRGFEGRDAHVHYAMKANSTLAVV
jgi:diaminopimelate decarboxylase